MTFIGHSITGVTIGLLAIPSTWRLRVTAPLLIGFAVLANLPDFRLPYWGHHRYDISHSIFINTGIILFIALPFLFLPSSRRHRVALRPLLLGASAAWVSHLFLDTFYNHGHGLAMFWPFSTARLSLAIPWFETVRKPLPHFDAHTVRVWLLELVSYGAVLALVLLVRKRYFRNGRRGV